jgi:hypothetical protein
MHLVDRLQHYHHDQCQRDPTFAIFAMAGGQGVPFMPQPTALSSNSAMRTQSCAAPPVSPSKCSRILA